jgi:hypothetical protein
VSESASLLLFGDEQISFPGIPPGVVSRPVTDPLPAGTGGSQCPGQLCLGPSQLLLTDADPEPLQPSLLPDPPPWELVEGPSDHRLEGGGGTAAGGGSTPPETAAARMPQLGLFPRHR